MEERRTESGKGWPRVAALFLAAVTVSVLEPGVLIALPFLLLVLFGGTGRAALVLAAGVAALVVASGSQRSGVWFLERGWAFLIGGWFLALTLRWPSSRFLTRALGSVAGAFAVVALFFGLRPRSWSVVDFLVTDQIRAGVASALAVMSTVGGADAVPPELSDAIYRTAEVQGLVFPALLGLSSVAALGVAWWIYVRMARGSDQGLRPLAEFRFNDQLVWVFIDGLLLVLIGPGQALDRAGTNAVVFMGALYALRGAAVLMFLTGGMSVMGGVLLALAMIFVAPVILAGMLVVGLGDTWLGLRERARAVTG